LLFVKLLNLQAPTMSLAPRECCKMVSTEFYPKINVLIWKNWKERRRMGCCTCVSIASFAGRLLGGWVVRTQKQSQVFTSFPFGNEFLLCLWQLDFQFFMKLKALKVRPKKLLEASPCIGEMGAMLECWSRSGVDDPRCAQTAKALATFMSKPVSYWHSITLGQL
jgi:hypothetical protein